MLAAALPLGRPIDAALRSQVISAAIDALEKGYVFPEKAAKMAAHVRAREAAGDFDSLASARQFAQALTRELQEVSRDSTSASPTAPGPCLGMATGGPPRTRPPAARGSCGETRDGP